MSLEQNYAAMVDALKKPGREISITITPDRADLIHMAMGISGEAGEFLDCVKKYVIYNKPWDHENAIEELGDLEFFLEGVRQLTGISRKMVLEHNMKKLSARYKDKVYSDEQAQARADKNINRGADDAEFGMKP